MNVSVLKKFVFYIIYAFWMRNTFFRPSVPLLHVWSSQIVCVKFYNNIKRRFGRVNDVDVSIFPATHRPRE